MNSSSLSYIKWKCQYHIVFIPKYRRRTLYGKIKADMREILIKLCKYKNVEIIEGAVCADHIYLCVSIPPKLSISEFMGYLKGKSALMIYDVHPEQGSKWRVERFGQEAITYRLWGISRKPQSRNTYKNSKKKLSKKK